ncbi:hypothetical protein ACFLU6_11990 [Acidobacteriota bacterium]
MKSRSFVVVTLGTMIFHLVWWRGDGARGNAPPTDFDHPATLTTITPVQETLLIRAGISWESMSDVQREQHVRSLWADVALKGYKRLILVNASGSKPLAIATLSEVKVFPIIEEKALGPVRQEPDSYFK